MASSEDAQRAFISGRIHYEEHDYRQAEAEFRRAVKADPSHYSAWVHLGDIYFRKNSMISACRALTRATQHEEFKLTSIDEQARILSQLSVVYGALSAKTAALEAARMAINLMPTSNLALLAYGQACLAKGDIDKAEHLLVKLQDPQDAMALEELISREKQQRSLHRHTDVVSLDMDPKNIGCWRDIAVQCERENNMDNAEDAFLMAVELGPSEAEPHFNLGLFYLHRGNIVLAQNQVTVLGGIDKGMADKLARLIVGRNQAE